MKTIFKWIGIALSSVLGLILVLAATLYFIGNARLNKVYIIPADTISIPNDAASLERGKHLADTLYAHCHTWRVSDEPPNHAVGIDKPVNR